MAPIKEPIDFDDLPDNVGQLKAFIFRLAFQKNAIIKARDQHINTLLDQNQSLECSLQLCRESLAAADGTSSPAPGSENSESERSSSTSPSSALSTPPPSPSSSGDTDSLPDLDNDEPASEMSGESSADLDNDEPASETESEFSPDLDNDETASEMGAGGSADFDSDAFAGATEPRTSSTPSVRSRTRGSCRVSKKQTRGRSAGNAPGKAVEKARRHCVWRYSEGDRFDWSDGTAKTMDVLQQSVLPTV